jgi:hypothetical protein
VRLASFSGLLILASTLLSGQSRFTGVERIVAIGDVHGDWEQFTEALRSAGLIDKKNKWAGGKTHFVQTGDIPDRGPATRKILDLLMDLEKQAAKAGGKIHCLVGNHDAMNVYGDLRYVIPEEFASFRSGDAQSLLDAAFEQDLPALKKAAQARGQSPSNDDLKKQWLETHPPGWVEHRFAFGPNGKYGKWIRGNDAMVIVNGFLFLHAGVSPKYAARKHTELNDRIRAELADFSLLEGGVAMDALGPLWYRGLARDPEESLAAHVDAVLQFHGIESIVIGHTVTAGAILPRFGGKVIMIDVGMSKAYGGPYAALLIEGAKRFAIHRGTKLDLPSTPDGLLAYIKQAAALDPQPSPLQKLLTGGAVEATKDVP